MMGYGDMAAILFLKKIFPRLTVYYALLAAVFLGGAFLSQYMTLAAMLANTIAFFGPLIDSSMTVGLWTIFILVSVLVMITMEIIFLARALGRFQ
jgi:hypothetical protein